MVISELVVVSTACPHHNTTAYLVMHALLLANKDVAVLMLRLCVCVCVCVCCCCCLCIVVALLVLLFLLLLFTYIRV